MTAALSVTSPPRNAAHTPRGHVGGRQDGRHEGLGGSQRRRQLLAPACTGGGVRCTERRYLRAVERSALCRSRRELSSDPNSSEYLLAKIGFDRAETSFSPFLLIRLGGGDLLRYLQFSKTDPVSSPRLGERDRSGIHATPRRTSLVRFARSPCTELLGSDRDCSSC